MSWRPYEVSMGTRLGDRNTNIGNRADSMRMEGQLKSEAKAYTSTHDNIFGPSTPAEKRQFGVEDDGQRAAGGFKQRHKEGEFYSAKPGESFGGVAAGDRNASNVVLALDAQPTNLAAGQRVSQLTSGNLGSGLIVQEDSDQGFSGSGEIFLPDDTLQRRQKGSGYLGKPRDQLFFGMLGAKAEPPKVHSRGDARKYAATGGASNLTASGGGLIPKARPGEHDRNIDLSQFMQRPEQPEFQRRRGL